MLSDGYVGTAGDTAFGGTRLHREGEGAEAPPRRMPPEGKGPTSLYF